MHNVMEVDGKEVHRKEVGKEIVRTGIKLEGGKKVPFKITYFTKDANGLGWIPCRPPELNRPLGP